MATNYLSQRSTILFQNNGSLIGAGYVYTADRHGNPSWTNSLSLNTVTYSTILGSSITGVSSIHAYTILGSTVTVSTITLASSIVSLGQSTNQTYYGQTNGVYTTGWGSTLNTLTSNVKQVTMGSLGNYQVAVCGASTANSVYVTQNSGQTWSTLSAATGLPLAASTLYTSGAVSATGQYGILATTGRYPYITSSFGATYANSYTVTYPNMPAIYLPLDTVPANGSVSQGTSPATLTVTTGGNAPTLVQGVVGANAIRLANTAGETASTYVFGTIGTNLTAFTVSGWFNIQSFPSAGNSSEIWTIGRPVDTFFGLSYRNGVTINSTTYTGIIFSFLNTIPPYTTIVIGYQPTIALNTWYNFTYVYNASGTCYAYINNILIGTVAGSISYTYNNTTRFALGTITNTTGNVSSAFNGYIDDFKIAFTPMVPMNYNYTAVSGNGQYMLASVSGGGLFMSSNFGSTWSQVTSVANQGAWSSLALSYTGQYMTATQLVTTGIMPQLTGLAANTWTVNGVNWTASASANLGETFPAYGAFNNYYGSAHPYSWASIGDQYNGANYTYSSDLRTNILGGIGSIGGDWVQIQSSIPLVMQSYSYASGGASNGLPKSGYIVGSNNNASWYPIQSWTMTINPLTVAFSTCTSYIIVNQNGTQTIQGNVTGSGTFTTYPTTTNAYTYFRCIFTSIWAVSLAEFGEWLINFTSGGQSYSTDYGSTWTNLNKMSISNALSMSENGQYLLGASGAVTTNNMPNSTAATQATWVANGVTWTASASSSLSSDSENPQPYKLFNTATGSPSTDVWASHYTYNTSTGLFTTGRSTTIQGGIMASPQNGEYFQLQSSIPLIMYSYRYACYNPTVVGKTYVIVGSNDNTNWYPIQSANITTNPFTGQFQPSTSNILINYNGAQSITAGQVESVTTTSYSTSTNAYTYFRFIGTSVFPNNHGFLEYAEVNYNFTNPNPLQSAYLLSNSPSGLSTNANTAISTINGNILATSLSNTGQYMALTVGTSLIYGEWVQLQLVTAVSITSYVLQLRLTLPQRFASAWTIVGSTDGVNWAILDTQTGQTSFGTTYILKTASPIYSYFRVIFTQISPSTSVVDLGGFILFNNSTPIFGPYTNYSIVQSGNYNIMQANSVTVCTVSWSWANTSSANALGVAGDGTSDLAIHTPGFIATPNGYTISSNYFIGFWAPAMGAAYEYNSSGLAIQGTYTSSVNPNLYYSTNYGSTFTGLSLGSAPLVSCSMSYDGSYITAASATTVYTLNSNGLGYSLAVGSSAGAANQSQNAIALGNSAGQTNQTANSIILNASGSALNSYSQGFYVAPIANYLSSPSSYYNVLGYGTDNQVVHCSNALVLSNAGYVGIGTSTPSNLLTILHLGINYTKPLLIVDAGIPANATAGAPRGIGQPLIGIGNSSWTSGGVAGDYYGIGFGYGGGAGGANYYPAEIGLYVTNSSGNTIGDIVFSTRPSTTNVVASERMRITSGGIIYLGVDNAGIGNSTAAGTYEGTYQYIQVRQSYLSTYNNSYAQVYKGNPLWIQAGQFHSNIYWTGNVSTQGGTLYLVGGNGPLSESTNNGAGTTNQFGGDVVIQGGSTNIGGNGQNVRGGHIIFNYQTPGTTGGQAITYTEAMRINGGNGFVGIKTSSPNISLDVAGTSNGIGRTRYYGSAHDVDKRDPLYIGRWDGDSYEFCGMRCNVDTAANAGMSGYNNQAWLSFHTWGNDHSNSREVMRLRSDGNMNIVGALSKASGTFDISHPLYPNTKKRLIHSFIEGPRCDLIYRGTTILNNGIATVYIDKQCTYSSAGAMDEGTFEALCANPDLFLQNRTGFNNIIGSIQGAILTITCENNTSTDTISWMVVAERKDPFIKQWDKTDANGYLITQYTANDN